ncbi:hypothetical protein KM043_008744 [Ampulex compressa]|nr:hypothetical protein KM043_008744 [Ampulex compressa]
MHDPAKRIPKRSRVLPEFVKRSMRGLPSRTNNEEFSFAQKPPARKVRFVSYEELRADLLEIRPLGSELGDERTAMGPSIDLDRALQLPREVENVKRGSHPREGMPRSP